MVPELPKTSYTEVMTRYAGKREKPVFMRVLRGDLYALTRAYTRFFRFMAIKNPPLIIIEKTASQTKNAVIRRTVSSGWRILIIMGGGNFN
jgi:hypothetical protein